MEKAWDGTRIRTTRRPRIRRLECRFPAARPWTARWPCSRGGAVLDVEILRKGPSGFLPGLSLARAAGR